MNLLLVNESQLFRKMVLYSTGAHVAVILFFLLKAAIFPNEALTLDAAIRVDMVGLPDKISHLPVETEKPLPKKAEEPKEEIVEKPKNQPVVINSRYKSKQEALEKIKKLAREEQKKNALEKIQEDIKKQEQAEKIQRQARLRDALLKGNAVSPGAQLHGLAKLQFDEYIIKAQAQVHKHWNLPEWLQNDNLKAVAVVFLDQNGVVTNRKILRSSGDVRFDGYVLRAIDESSPLPPPPSRLTGRLGSEGLIFGFPE